MLWKRQFPSPGTCLTKTGTLCNSLSLSTRRRSLLLPLRVPPRPPPPPGPCLPRMLARDSHSPGHRAYASDRKPFGSIFGEGFQGGWKWEGVWE
jgi:hypothetical protein